MIDQLREELAEAVRKSGIDPEGALELERTKDIAFGDLSSNAPLVFAKPAGLAPMQLAEKIVAHLSIDPAIILKVEIAAPGFLNFTFSAPFLENQLRAISDQGPRYGRSDAGRGKRALVEFVSANPTGPLTVGHGRGAVLGDTISSILAWNGYMVEREYYYNDAGLQIQRLGASVQARYLEALGRDFEFPEEGYQGDYIRDIAAEIITDQGEDLTEVSDFSSAAIGSIFKGISKTLEGMGIRFDNFVNELDLHKTGKNGQSAISEVIDTLKAKGVIVERDGATWIKAEALEGDKDKVLIKSSGEPTYRLPDIAYHRDKIERGYDLIIDIFGADHFDTYPDVIAGVKELGLPTDRIKVLIHQFVTLIKGGQQVKMSTRKASFVTLDELLEEVGADVVRYFFLAKTMSSPLKFDLELALKSSDDNPVYYLKYAHARMVNILKRGAAAEMRPDVDGADLSLLRLPEERLLLHLLWLFPEVVKNTGKSLEPHHIAIYLDELAKAFHRYYTVARVVTDDMKLSLARLVITDACRQTLANGLTVLGIEAPDRM
ncbi:MAG: arginine--tRNA ligase [Candidatus Marinimicrobia bacterium]|nr:arginine--tRNA ligase [Candidatus Neomarinimicrobiota bacterium]